MILFLGTFVWFDMHCFNLREKETRAKKAALKIQFFVVTR